MDIALDAENLHAAQSCYDVAVYLIDLGCEVDKLKLKFLLAASICGKVDKIKKQVVELESDLNGEHMAKHTDNHNSGYLRMVVQHCIWALTVS